MVDSRNSAAHRLRKVFSAREVVVGPVSKLRSAGYIGEPVGTGHRRMVVQRSPIGLRLGLDDPRGAAAWHRPSLVGRTLGMLCRTNQPVIQPAIETRKLRGLTSAISTIHRGEPALNFRRPCFFFAALTQGALWHATAYFCVVLGVAWNFSRWAFAKSG
jgi:hypothetical protein